MTRGRLAKPIYESLPVLYALIGVVLLGLSYRFEAAEWSGLCAVGGLLGQVAGLAIWMHRRD